jgi:hypothetical protein
MPFFNGKEISLLKFSFTVLLLCLIPLKTYASNKGNTNFCERDCSMEYNFFKKYAREGSSLANLSMAIMNYQGHGRSKNIELANKQLIRAARAAEPAALYQLAYNLMFGLYIEQDLNKSLIWFKRADKHGVENSKKYIGLLNDFLKIKNEEIKLSMKSILIENVNPAERIVNIKDKDESIERISVTQQFYWSFVLYNSELQTCNVNCIMGSSHTMIPIIHVMNENKILDTLTKLTKNSLITL